MSGKRYTKSDRAKAKRLYVQRKWSLSQIAREPDMPNDPKTIRRWLEGMRVKMRGNPHKYPRKKILRELRKKNCNRDAVAEKYGCSLKYLSNLASGKLQP